MTLFSTRLQIVLSSLLIVSSMAIAQDRETESQEASGILNAWISNAHGMDSYEYYLETWESGLRPDETLHEKRTVHLVGGDHLEKRFYTLARIDVVDDGEHRTCVSSATVNAERGQVLRCDGESEELVGATHQQVLDAADVVDIRLLGHRRFPKHFGNRTLAAYFEQLYSPARPFRFPLSSHGSAVATIEQSVKGSSAEFVSSWKLDTSRYVPHEFSMRILNPKSGKWVTLVKEDYVWKEQAGIQLPISVLGQHSLAGKDADGVNRYYEVDFEARIHWKSINQELSEDRFNFANYSRASAVLERLESAEKKVKF